MEDGKTMRRHAGTHTLGRETRDREAVFVDHVTAERLRVLIHLVAQRTPLR